MSVLQVSTAHQLTPRPALEPLQLAQADVKKRRLMLLADYVHPFVYRDGFPQGVPDVDMVLAAGDLPGYYLEYLATKLPVPVLYVPGNHENEYINEGDGRIPARGWRAKPATSSAAPTSRASSPARSGRRPGRRASAPTSTIRRPATSPSPSCAPRTASRPKVSSKAAATCSWSRRSSTRSTPRRRSSPSTS